MPVLKYSPLLSILRLVLVGIWDAIIRDEMELGSQ